MANMFDMFAHTAAFYLIIVIAVYLNRKWSSTGGYIGWVLLVWIHFPIATGLLGRIGQYCMYFQVMTLGVVLVRYPMNGRSQLRVLVSTMWPFFLIVLYFLTYGITVGAPDELPVGQVDLVRWAITNFLFAVVLCCPFAPVRGEEPTWTTPVDTAFLSYWSLFVYLSHYMFIQFAEYNGRFGGGSQEDQLWYRIAYVALPMFLTLPIFWAVCKWIKKKKQSRQEHTKVAVAEDLETGNKSGSFASLEDAN